MADRTIADLIMDRPAGAAQSSTPAPDLGRVKRNVAKMVDMSAPEAEIDAYIQGEGTTVDAIRSHTVDIGKDIAKGVGYGWNEGIDAGLNILSSPVRVPINAAASALGYGEVIPEIQAARRFNVAGPAESLPGRVAQTVSEVAGGSALPSAGLATAGKVMASAPGMIANYAARPAAALGTDAVSAAGAGLGVATARENELGPTAELVAGLAGGFVAPNALNIASRGKAAAEGARDYAGRQMARARNPQMAADQDTIDALSKSGVTTRDLLGEFAPQPSNALQGRNITPEDMADMISSAAKKEPTAAIAKRYGIAESTLQNYLREYKQMNPTPRNIADAVQDLTDVGAAQPTLRLGRAAFGIADDAKAASALTKRQNDQYGRTVGIINRAAKNRDYDATIEALDETLGAKSKAAYGAAKTSEQPFDLAPAIRDQREVAFKSAGNIKKGLEEAIDLFYEPVMGPDGKVAKLGQPIADVERYQGAREALDDLITNSKDNVGKNTRLTARLTALRRSVNQVVRDANPLLGAADDQFSGAKATQALLKRGEDLTGRLGSKADEFFKDYKTLAPEQKEVIRLGFLRKLANQAATPREGAAVANQFQSNAVKQVIAKLFSPDAVPANISKAEAAAFAKRNKETIALGRDIVKGLKREATTTNTLNAVTNRGNTQTAPWARDMDKMAEGAQMVGDVFTLNWIGAIKKTGMKLATQIGEKQARLILDNLTNTDPADILPTLRRLGDAAKTQADRQAYVIALKEFGKVGRRPAADIGTVTAATRESTPPLNSLNAKP